MGLFGKRTELDGAAVLTPGTHPGPPPHYGIEDAIRLMRGLPVEHNLELVVGVVKSTLASLDVHLATIIEDAARKQQGIEQRIAVLRSEIADHEAEIVKRRKEIDVLEQDLAETTQVKDNLQYAEAHQTPRPQSGGPVATHPTPSARPAHLQRSSVDDVLEMDISK